MILSTQQPYFAPSAGFFRKAQRSDVFVILDNVQFPHGTTWITRNRFKNDQGTLWMTIPVWKKGLGLQRIDEVRICREGRWVEKHLASFKHAYAKAPYFGEHIDFMNSLFSARHERMIDLNLAIIEHLMQQLGVAVEIKLLSKLDIKAHGTQLLIDICEYLGASTYLAQTAAQKHLDAGLFRKAGIKLRYFNFPCCKYPQLWGDFIANLSALDLLFNCGPKSHDIMMRP